MSEPASLLFATWLAFAPTAKARLDLDAEGLDPTAVENGLRARVGDELDEWSIEVERETETVYRVVLRRRGSRVDRRDVTLIGETEEDRSRELAATLAVILDARDGSVETREPPLWFSVVESRVQLGPARDLDPSVGLGLGGGAWLLGEHLQPRARVGWSHSWAGTLAVHQVDLGVGLAAGAPIGRFWFGVLALPSAKWTYARQQRASSGWFGGGELSVLGQWRQSRGRPRPGLVVGVRTGVETTFPAPRAPGTETVIRWGHVRWLAVIELGFGI